MQAMYWFARLSVRRIAVAAILVAVAAAILSVALTRSGVIGYAAWKLGLEWSYTPPISRPVHMTFVGDVGYVHRESDGITRIEAVPRRVAGSRASSGKPPPPWAKSPSNDSEVVVSDLIGWPFQWLLEYHVFEAQDRDHLIDEDNLLCATNYPWMASSSTWITGVPKRSFSVRGKSLAACLAKVITIVGAPLLIAKLVAAHIVARRASAHRCRRCRYPSVAGSTACPECGLEHSSRQP